MRRPTRRTSAVLAAAACLLAGGVLTGARALVPVHSRPAAAPSPSLSLPSPPPGSYFPLGLTVDRSVQSVQRAKISFNVHPFRALAWTQALPEQPVDPKYAWNDATAKIYVTTPGAAVDQFGEFAPVHVKMLAFGNIPVSATVHISQIKDGAKVVPFTVTFRFTGKPVHPPKPLPCSPPAAPENRCFYTEAPKLSGKVDVRVDNVRIDKVPVDVGPDCHTAQPATMSLSADAGYYSPIDPVYEPPDLYLPLPAGGILHGPVDVPAFTGCRNGDDDLSRVVTAMVAGPDNELATHQDGPLVVYPPPPLQK